MIMNRMRNAFVALLMLTVGGSLGFASEREILNFNPDWKFTKADPAGAEAPGFDDRAWTTVSAPHTFNDTDTFDNWSTPGHRGEQIQWSGWVYSSMIVLVPLHEAYHRKRASFKAEN